MARRGTGDKAAADAASEAGRILQAQRETLKDYAPAEPSPEPRTEPKADPEPEQRQTRQKREEKPDVEERKPDTLLRNEPRRRALAEIENRDLKEKGVTPEPEHEHKPEKTADTSKKDAKSDTSTASVDATNTATPAATDGTSPSQEGVEQQAAAAPEPAAPVYVRVKVDGKEFDAPQSEVEDAGGIKPYQVMKAQENRLKAANEALAQTRQAQAYIAQMIQAQQPKTPTLTDDQFIASKVDTIRFGTPEESAAALREVMQRGNPKIDQDVITKNAISQMRQMGAVDNFKKEFQDIVSNPILMRAAAQIENERRPQTNHETDWETFYRGIGNEVRSAVPRQHQSAAPAVAKVADQTADTTSPTSDREARKASIVNLPTAAARATLSDDSKPETREDILNQMRKARHLPTG